MDAGTGSEEEVSLCGLSLGKYFMLEILKSRKNHVPSQLMSPSISASVEHEDLHDGHQGSPFSQCVLA